jgi:hypothetical protein
MRKTTSLLFTLILVACGRAGPLETVGSLAANPERLSELRQQCKTDRARVGDARCTRAAEATNWRFLGDGKTPYTPRKNRPGSDRWLEAFMARDRAFRRGSGDHQTSARAGISTGQQG